MIGINRHPRRLQLGRQFSGGGVTGGTPPISGDNQATQGSTAIWDAIWVKGKMHTVSSSHEMATASYSMEAVEVSVYEE